MGMVLKPVAVLYIGAVERNLVDPVRVEILSDTDNAEWIWFKFG